MEASLTSAPTGFGRTPPGPKATALLSNLLNLRKDVLNFVLDATRQYGDVIRFQVGPRSIYLLNHPDHVKRVLQTNRLNYHKGRSVESLKAFWGEGLLSQEDDVWLEQRRQIQPAFHRA